VDVGAAADAAGNAAATTVAGAGVGVLRSESVCPFLSAGLEKIHLSLYLPLLGLETAFLRGV
jgi:hypothetical protein